MRGAGNRPTLVKECMFSALKNLIKGDEVEEDLDLGLTPWKLCLINPLHPLQIFIYFATHEEAKDQEDSCKEKGWTSLGIVWYS